MDEFSKNYENVLFLCDFNKRQCKTSFCSSNDLTSLTDQPTCYKNPDEPTCIDLILKNLPNCIQSNAFETGLSDFHMMVVSELKMRFQKLKPHTVSYCEYKHFDKEKFWSDIQSFASEKNVECFKEAVFCTFNKHALIKRKYVRVNDVPLIRKELHKAIVERPR